MLGSKIQKGFIALTSTIIIAAVLLILAVSVASSGFQGRFSVFDGEVKEVSRGLAEACVQYAILEHARDNTFTGNSVQPVGPPSDGRECVIVSVSGLPSSVLIRTKAQTQNSYTNLEVSLDATNNYEILSWEEVPEF